MGEEGRGRGGRGRGEGKGEGEGEGRGRGRGRGRERERERERGVHSGLLTFALNPSSETYLMKALKKPNFVGASKQKLITSTILFSGEDQSYSS